MFDKKPAVQSSDLKLITPHATQSAVNFVASLESLPLDERFNFAQRNYPQTCTLDFARSANLVKTIAALKPEHRPYFAMIHSQDIQDWLSLSAVLKYFLPSDREGFIRHCLNGNHKLIHSAFFWAVIPLVPESTQLDFANAYAANVTIQQGFLNIVSALRPLNRLPFLLNNKAYIGINADLMPYLAILSESERIVFLHHNLEKITDKADFLNLPKDDVFDKKTVEEYLEKAISMPREEPAIHSSGASLNCWEQFYERKVGALDSSLMSIAL